MEQIRDLAPLPLMFAMLMERVHHALLVLEVTLVPRLIRIRDALMKHLSASQKRVIVSEPPETNIPGGLVMEPIRDLAPLPLIFVMLMERVRHALLVLEVTMAPRLIHIRDA